MAEAKAVQNQEALLWHNLEMDKALALLNSPHRGLNHDGVRERLAKFGSNELVEKHNSNP